MTPEELKRFDEASNHPYECRCELCKEWWEQVPPEESEPFDLNDEDAPPAFLSDSKRTAAREQIARYEAHTYRGDAWSGSAGGVDYQVYLNGKWYLTVTEENKAKQICKWANNSAGMAVREGRSVQKRIAAQKGESVPTFEPASEPQGRAKFEAWWKSQTLILANKELTWAVWQAAYSACMAAREGAVELLSSQYRAKDIMAARICDKLEAAGEREKGLREALEKSTERLSFIRNMANPKCPPIIESLWTIANNACEEAESALAKLQKEKL